MALLNRLLVSCASIPVPGPPEEEIKSTIRYILSGSDYTIRVKRANKLKFTYLPPLDGRAQPGPMNELDRFLTGGWRKYGWEDYDIKEQKNAGKMAKRSDSKKENIGRRLIWAFFGSAFLGIALSFIVWLIIMMGISELGLEGKLGLADDPINLLLGFWIIFSVLFFLGSLMRIKST
jgi:hypothetical protein